MGMTYVILRGNFPIGAAETEKKFSFPTTYKSTTEPG